jgi:hypothetical protein
LRKGGEAVMLKNLTLPLMMLVASTVCDGLVVPMTTLPKLRLVGLTLSDCALASAGAAQPAIAKSRVKTENAKRDDFVRDMAFLPRSNERLQKRPPSLSRPDNFRFGSRLGM